MDDGRNRMWCNICNLSLNSQSQAEQHYAGRVHLNKLKEHRMMDASDQNSTGNNSSSGLSWCPVCSLNLDPQTSSEHFETRTHLNRCLQKGVGISLVPGSGIKEGERSSSWCSVCNHALESVAQAEEHYESRAHLNKCLQRGVGIPLTYAAAASAPCAPLPTGPRFSQASGATSPGTSGFPPPGAGSFRPGIAGVQHKPRPRVPFTPNSRPAFGAKKFPNQPFIRGQAQSNPRMAVPYGGGGGYNQEMRPADNFSQYDTSWQQNQPTGKTSWPYCETCDQNFPTIGALSQHCNSSAHMEMKMMKQTQYHAGPSQGGGDQSRFYQGGAGHVRAQAPNQGQYYGNQGAAQQDSYRGSNTQNQGAHYSAKEWRPFNRNNQFLS